MMPKAPAWLRGTGMVATVMSASASACSAMMFRKSIR
jgi:hypothetical protein